MNESGLPLARCARCNLRHGVASRKPPSQEAKLFAKDYPVKATEFVRNLDHPAALLSEMPTYSRDLCEWKCGICSEKFETKPAHRRNSADELGCPDCRKQNVLRSYVTRVSKSESLASIRPDIAAQFVELINYPGVMATQIAVGSDQMARWNCRCGAKFERKVNRVVTRGSRTCESCSRSGKSLFEFEVAELLGAITGLKVETHHLRLVNAPVDLYLSDSDTAVQLDPYWSHYQRYEQDIQRIAQLQPLYTTVIRIREDTLPIIQGYPTVSTKDRMDWAIAVASALNVPTKILSTRQKTEALVRAAERWMGVGDESGLTVSAADSIWSSEFTQNITHPGKRLNFSTPKSEDECEWNCTYCGKTWNQSIDKRNRRLTLGCETCARKENGVRQRAARQSLVDTFASNLSEQDCKNLWENLYTSPQWRQILRYVAQFDHPVRLRDIEVGINMKRNFLGQFKIRLIKAGALKSAGFGLVEFTDEDFRTYIAKQSA